MTNNGPLHLERSSRLLRFDMIPTENGNEGPIALLRLACNLVIRHRLKMLVCTTVGLGLGIAYAHSLQPVYTATTTLLLEPRRQPAVSGQDVSAQGLDVNRADSELQIIRSERLLATVFDTLKLKANAEFGPKPTPKLNRIISNATDLIEEKLRQNFPSEAASFGVATKPSLPVSAETDDTLKQVTDARQAAFINFTRHIEVRRLGQSYVIEIEFSSSDRALPAIVANATASAYILQSVAFKQQMSISGTEALQWRLDALSAQVEAAMAAVKSGTLPAIATPDADARVIGAALPPLSPAGPRTTLIIAFGGVLGLLAGFSILALNVALDRRIRDAKELTRIIGVPYLGSLPTVRRGNDKPGHANYDINRIVIQKPRSQYATAIRDFRTSIEIACSSVRNKRNVVVAMVGWDVASGTSGLCLSLAQLINHGGRKVTLFTADADEGRTSAGPTDSTMATNLADMLITDVKPGKVVFSQGDSEGFLVLPIHSKNPGSNLFADFRDRRVSDVIEAARNSGDVLLDLPPLSGSNDALALAIHADAVVVVVTEARTTTDEALELVQQLRRAGANIIGTVINHANL